MKKDKFYEDILNGTYDAPLEKEASEKEEDIREKLADLNDPELDALARELGMFSKEASDIQMSLEDSLFGNEEETDVEKQANENPESEIEQVEAKEEEVQEREQEQAEKTAAEENDDSDTEFEIVKQACEQIESDLAGGGYTLADWIYSKDESLEKYASEIADTAEKIAYVYDLPRILVASDLLDTMSEAIDSEA